MEILELDNSLDTRRLFLSEESERPENWHWLSQWCRDEYPCDRWGYASSYFMQYLTAMHSLFPKQMRSMPIDKQKILEVERADLADILREGNSSFYTRKLAELKLCFPDEQFEIPHQIKEYWNVKTALFENEPKTDNKRLSLQGNEHQLGLLALIKLIHQPGTKNVKISTSNIATIEYHITRWQKEDMDETLIESLIALKILGLERIIPIDLTRSIAYLKHKMQGGRLMRDGVAYCRSALRLKLLTATKISFGQRPGYVVTPDESSEYSFPNRTLPTLKKFFGRNPLY